MHLQHLLTLPKSLESLISFLQKMPFTRMQLLATIGQLKRAQLNLLEERISKSQTGLSVSSLSWTANTDSFSRIRLRKTKVQVLCLISTLLNQDHFLYCQNSKNSFLLLILVALLKCIQVSSISTKIIPKLSSKTLRMQQTRFLILRIQWTSCLVVLKLWFLSSLIAKLSIQELKTKIYLSSITPLQ